jgi:hypothetical protein
MRCFGMRGCGLLVLGLLVLGLLGLWLCCDVNFGEEVDACITAFCSVVDDIGDNAASSGERSSLHDVAMRRVHMIVDASA